MLAVILVRLLVVHDTPCDPLRSDQS
jgi:hypothetical protein